MIETLQIGSVVPHPGLGPVTEELYEEETVTHKFYQWVAFTLYFQVWQWFHNQSHIGHYFLMLGLVLFAPLYNVEKMGRG